MALSEWQTDSTSSGIVSQSTTLAYLISDPWGEIPPRRDAKTPKSIKSLSLALLVTLPGTVHWEQLLIRPRNTKSFDMQLASASSTTILLVFRGRINSCSRCTVPGSVTSNARDTLVLQSPEPITSHREVSEVGVKLGVTSGYARPPKVCDISFKYHPPPLVVAPTFSTRL